MDRAGIKGRPLTFDLFTLKWIRLKNPDEIEKRNADS